MKVVHIVESFAGGVFNFIADIVLGMPEYRHIIIHGMRQDTPSAFESAFPKGTGFYRWQHATREVSPARDMRATLELAGILKHMKNADIIHLHSSKAGFIGRLVCRMLGMQDRVLYSPHGASFLRKDISDTRGRFFALLEKTAARFGGEVIGSALSEAEAIRKEGIPAMHINNGIACEGDPSACTRRETLLIGTSARITNQKNPGLFNEIAEAFVTDPSVRFLWIGDGELRRQLSSPNIQVAGWLPKDALKNMLHELDIYLSTSLWEGMPLSVLLAMCAGKPLLLFDCAGNRDLVDRGLNGFIFRDKREAVSCIKTLISNRHMIEEMGKCSRALVLENFTLDKMICQYKQLYLETARKAGGEQPRCSA
jgi:glycosyltransferase involved in cell wall biosynthesis